MQNTNLVIIKGALSKTPDIRGSEYKTTVLTVAGVMTIDGRERPFFQQARARGKDATFMAQLEAGTPVIIKGTLRQESWESENGTKNYATYVKAIQARPLPNPSDYQIEQRETAGGNQYYTMTNGGYVSVTVDGNIARELEMRYTGSGDAVVSGGFGNNEEWISSGQTQSHTNWLDFTLWREDAELAASLGVGKGWSIGIINGTLVNGSYVSNKTGKKVYTTKIEKGNGHIELLPKAGGSAPVMSAGLDIDDLFATPSSDGAGEEMPF